MIAAAFCIAQHPTEVAACNGSDFPPQYQYLSPASRSSALCSSSAFVLWVIGGVVRSPYATDQGIEREQPVPFSHQHHVAGLGIDCRYCHTSVETSNFAGIPPTQTCMNCHAQIWTNAAMLEPVRASFATDKPIVWSRVHRLPDFVHFNHSHPRQQRASAARAATAASTRWP